MESLILPISLSSTHPLLARNTQQNYQDPCSDGTRLWTHEAKQALWVMEPSFRSLLSCSSFRERAQGHQESDRSVDIKNSRTQRPLHALPQYLHQCSSRDRCMVAESLAQTIKIKGKLYWESYAPVTISEIWVESNRDLRSGNRQAWHRVYFWEKMKIKFLGLEWWYKQ